ncbi:hypothetical protein [Flavobacterium cyclinae]|uniref:hypothetical protein n=1 Tax=Flavobacterium cyclinae TaxID=2895947 RepID=UPI001E2BA1B3|nr:hypothetical protein [Flavobacterium cyclinae]UGS22201.1 hypothetical protein LOS86_06145 [Flavobacterium cyclinae]
MIEYQNYIKFDEDFVMDNIDNKILCLAIKNIIDFKKRLPKVDIKYISLTKRFEKIDDNILNSLLKDICKYFVNDSPPSIEDIFIQQHFEVAFLNNQSNKLSNDDKILRLKDYSPILGYKDKEEIFKNDVNFYLFNNLNS